MSDANKKFQILATSGGRCGGRTQALVKMCIESGSTLVCHNEAFAKQLMAKHPELKACKPIDPDKCRGVATVFIPDHHYLEVLWAEREREFKEELKKAKEGLNAKD